MVKLAGVTYPTRKAPTHSTSWPSKASWQQGFEGPQWGTGQLAQGKSLQHTQSSPAQISSVIATCNTCTALKLQLLRWNRKWRIIWITPAIMHSLTLTTLTCWRMAEIKAKVCEFLPPFSPLSYQSFSKHSASFYPSHSHRIVSIQVSTDSKKCKLKQLSGLFKEKKKLQKFFCLSDLGNCFHFHISSPS